MINMIRTWLLSLIGVALILTILYSLLPNKPIRAVARSIGSLLLALLLLRPLVSTQVDRLVLSYQETGQQIDEQIAQYQQQGREEYETIIARETAAYIQNMSAAYGLSCQPKVTVQWQDHVPLPGSVSLDIPYSAALSREITKQLGIPAAQQHWKEES